MKIAKRVSIGICTLIYVGSLPYAIILFEALRSVFPLKLIKAFPPMVLIFGLLAYLRYCRSQKRDLGLVSFFIPSTALIIGVFLIEKNPIKYIHIPQYFVLTLLIFKVLRGHDTAKNLIPYSIFFASCLGAIDEIHHGLHPARYFGSKDMLINMVGAVVGGLFLRMLLIGESPPKNVPNTLKVSQKSTSLLLAFTLTAICVSKLFNVANTPLHGWSQYPFALLLINFLFVVGSIFLLYKNQNTVLENSPMALTWFYPYVLTLITHSIIALGFLSGTQFR